MQEFIENNPQMFMWLVIAIAVIFIVIRIVVARAENKKKKAILSDEDVVEIIFKEAIFPASRTLTNRGLSGYKIFKVNDQEPRILGGNLIVPSGKALIELQYITTNNSFGSRDTTSFEQQQVSLELEKGKRYVMDFNIMDYTFSYKALK